MRGSEGMAMAWPKPGKALRGVMLVVFVIWLTFAIGLNWGSAPTSVFEVLTGNTERVLHGEVWRLLTAPLLTYPVGQAGVSHLITTLLGLYFLATRLEEQWGAGRMLRFLAISAVLSYTVQMLLQAVLPASIGQRLVGEAWFGMGPSLTAVAVAWALTFKNSEVRLFFVIPVSSRVLLISIVGLGLLSLVAGATPTEGLIAMFGGMGCGWLLGGGTPSPLRKAWLKLRLAQLDGEARRENARKKPRPNPGGLRVIPGGRSSDDDDRGPDGRFLN